MAQALGVRVVSSSYQPYVGAGVLIDASLLMNDVRKHGAFVHSITGSWIIVLIVKVKLIKSF